MALFGSYEPLVRKLLKTGWGLLLIAAGWLIVKRMLRAAARHIDKNEMIRYHPQFFKIIETSLFYAVLLLIGTFIIRQYNILLIERVFWAVMVIFLANPAREILVVVLNYFEKNLAARTETKVDNIVFELLNKFAGAILYATAIVLALDLLGVNVMPFIAGAGVAGLALGFAAKDTLSNFIAGVLLIIDRPFEVGDRIEVWNAPQGTATWGDVLDIGLRATKIRTTDNLVIVIPNNEIMKRDIVNYTLMSADIRVRVDIGVAYNADIQRAKELILKVADSADWILKDPPPKVVVKHFGESSVGLQLRVWISNARKRMDTISYLTDKVKEAFDAAGVEIPYPKRDIIVTYKNRSPQNPENQP